jgi:FtsP/CotA-like multicopper oxidase with cupredoxin domain
MTENMNKMRAYLKLLAVAYLFCWAVSIVMAQSNCPPRPLQGSVVENPFSLRSANGALTIGLTLENSIDSTGYLHDCLNYQAPNRVVEAPTWHLNPGDELTLHLSDELVANPLQPEKSSRMRGMAPMTMKEGACLGGTVTGLTTNMHFHGLNIPPTCHQDDVLTTLIQPFTPAFTYKTQIPLNEPPGLYWYHPHPHGFTTIQVNGGAAGALIVDGIEKVKPQVAGLPARVLVIRQQFLNPNSWLPGTNLLTLNFVPIEPPSTNVPVIKMAPGAREFWRVANASTQAFLMLQILNGGTPQNLEMIAYDGVPVQTDTEVTSILLAPAARAEFIMQGPAAGGEEVFQTAGYDTGPVGNPNPQMVLANIVPAANAAEPEAIPLTTAVPQSVVAQSMPAPRFGGLLTQQVSAKRKLYFAEATQGSNGPTEYFITVDGQQPKLFDVNDPPAIETQVGAVEDWTIENHSGETHAFHIHQLHFLVMEVSGKPVADPELHDTITVPYWNGKGPFPSVRIRVDFRDPEIAGTFVYHCHILDHEDGGMMAKIRVAPAK